MNYIVVDFEWNQTSYGKGSENRKIPFEIIEIGAVKLNEKRKEVDRFSRTIRPKVYKKLHYITKELTGITQEELNVSDPFTYVLVDFMLWCGKDYTFCTWGNMDLVELQRNMKYYGLLDLLKGPVKYYNVQKLFRELCAHDTAAASLETAVDYFELPKSEDFHRAVNDAAYTAEIFRRVDREAAKKLYSIDYYQNPQTKKEEIHLRYDSYYKYISRVFDTREEAMADKEVRSTRCYKCGRAARKRMHWFSAKAKAYYCLADCPEHGYIRGKIRIKKDDEQRIYVVKTLRLIDAEKADQLRQMKADVLQKRRERRQKGCQCH